MNIPSIKLRFKALFFDYLLIVFYLIILLGITMGIYLIVFNEIPNFSYLETQLIAFFTTILPITIFFIISEAKYPYASFGKKKVGLRVNYQSNPIYGSIIRNIFKFMPWQIAHFSVIMGMFQGFDNIVVLFNYVLSVVLLVLYISMVIFSKKHRHIPDIISKSIIIKIDE